MCHCHLPTAVVEIDSVSEVEGKNEDTSSSLICIIDVPLSLTLCSGRDRQSVLVKLRERMKTPEVQWHALLIFHCHLLTVVIKCVSEVEGKNEDTTVVQ